MKVYSFPLTLSTLGKILWVKFSAGDLHEISNPVFWKKLKKTQKNTSLLSAELAKTVAKVKISISKVHVTILLTPSRCLNSWPEIMLTKFWLAYSSAASIKVATQFSTESDHFRRGIFSFSLWHSRRQSIMLIIFWKKKKKSKDGDSGPWKYHFCPKPWKYQFCPK